ncbi:hypothetical protein BDK51DRAFT_30692, partial [Blyttiomyces helicus]
FCTACGGGGRFRTGKWRPRELFLVGRKTCSLQHERLGPTVTEFKVLRAPEELPDSVLDLMEALWRVENLKVNGLPRVMNSSLGIETFDKLETRATRSRAEMRRLLSAPGEPGRQRYVALMWAAPVARRKPPAPAAQQPAPASSPLSDPLTAPLAPHVPSDPEATLRGFASADVDLVHGIVYISYSLLCPPSPATFNAAFAALFKGLRSDLRARYDPDPPSLNHVWLAERRQVIKTPIPDAAPPPHVRAPVAPDAPPRAAIWEALGFRPLADHVGGQRKRGLPVCMEWFERWRYLPPGTESEFEDFAVAFDRGSANSRSQLFGCTGAHPSHSKPSSTPCNGGSPGVGGVQPVFNASQPAGYSSRGLLVSKNMVLSWKLAGGNGTK